MARKIAFRWRVIGLVLIFGLVFCIGVAIEMSKPLPIREMPETEIGPVVKQDDIPHADYRTPEFVLTTIDLLRQWYFAPEKVSVTKLLNIATGAISEALAKEGVGKSLRLASPQMTESEARAQFTEQFESAKSALEIRHNPRAYALGLEAASAILDSFGDSHTYLLMPSALGRAIILDEPYLGLRIIELRRDFIYIDRVVSHHNASAAGLKRFDRIIAINGSRIVGGNAQFSSRLDALRSGRLGFYAGTVRLEIARDGKNITENVALSPRSFPVGEAKTIEIENKKIHYFDLSRFDATPQRGAMFIEGYSLIRNYLDTNEAKGIILDLRANLGGELIDLEMLCSCFLKEATFLFREYHKNDIPIERVVSYGSQPPTDLPLVVLVDGWSCSAAELFAQVMKDCSRAVIIGQKTNGAVRVGFEFWVSEEMPINISLARVKTKNGLDLEGIGVTPDIEIALTEEDIVAGRDPQLEKAREVLLELMKK